MSEPKTDSRIALFIERLATLDAGSRARLKRCAGKTLDEANSALGLFYGLLQHLGVPTYQEGHYWMIATLYPHGDAAASGNFGAALRRARSAQYRKGLDRRVEALLDADVAQLPYRLGQAVRFLHAQRVSINWQGLLTDILQWEHPNRFVQKEWARAYYALPADQLEQKASKDKNLQENE